MKLVGERVREQRLRLGLSIDDVAKRSASSIHFIKELEWSMLKDIDLRTLISVAAAVELQASDLLA
jgi:cytoskeletal protein RodZ